MQPRHHNSSAVEAATLGVFLLAYSNGLAAWALRQGKDTELTFRRLNPILLMVLLVYAWFRRGGWARSGVSRKGFGKSLGWGTAVGALLAAPPALFFNNPVLLDGPLEYGPVARMTKEELLLDMFLRVPLSIASLEELSFRGLLYSALRARLSARASILWSAAAFAGWHFTVTAATGKETNLAGAKIPFALKPYIPQLTVLGGLLSTGVAGAVFAGLREKTDNLAGPIVAHWLVDSLMIGVLWLKRPNKDADATPLT